MSDGRITARAFHASGGVEDWRVLYWGAYAHYRTSSFAAGSEFASAIAEVADELGHYPDVDLRPDGVTIRTFTRLDGALSEADIDLARRITALAEQRAIEADPSRLQVVGIAVAQDAGADVRPFWAAAFGYEESVRRMPSIRTAGIPICGFTSSSRPGVVGAGSTSTSVSQPTRPRPESPPLSPPGVESPTTHMLLSGGSWPRRRTTVSISQRGPISRTTRLEGEVDEAFALVSSSWMRPWHQLECRGPATKKPMLLGGSGGCSLPSATRNRPKSGSRR